MALTLMQRIVNLILLVKSFQMSTDFADHRFRLHTEQLLGVILICGAFFKRLPGASSKFAAQVTLFEKLGWFVSQESCDVFLQGMQAAGVMSGGGSSYEPQQVRKYSRSVKICSLPRN